MRAYIKYIFLGIIMILTMSSDDPPKKKKDTIPDTTIIQKEQMVIQEETRTRMGKWDSLLMKQDTLLKKK